jgi:hypothetical protein
MICSLNPFYLEKNISIVSGIEGKWLAQPVKAKSDTTSQDKPHVWELADTASVWRINRVISEEKIKTPKGKDSTVFRPQNFYSAKLTGNTSDTSRYQFRLVLFRINGALYGDFSPLEITDIQSCRMAKESYFKVHTLARIKVQDKQLSVVWLGSDYMRGMIEKKRVRIKYRYVPDAGRLLLTASSEELTSMIERYADQKRFIDWEDQPAMLKLNKIN